jgi:hypothetical protein
MAGPRQRRGLPPAAAQSMPVCNLCASPAGSPHRRGNGRHPLESDTRIITGVQTRMARAALQWSVGEVARAANVPLITVKRVELDHTTDAMNLIAIRAALEAAGCEFLDEKSGGPGMRLRRLVDR